MHTYVHVWGWVGKSWNLQFFFRDYVYIHMYVQVQKAIIGGKRPYIPILVTRKGLANNPCMRTNEDSMHLFSRVYKGGVIQGKSLVQFHPLFW